jgi:hypothetical protein
VELHPDSHPTKLWLQLHPHLAVITEPQSLQKTTHLILVDTVDDLRSDSVSQNAREPCRVLATPRRYVGLIPSEHSSVGQQRLGRLSKQGPHISSPSQSGERETERSRNRENATPLAWEWLLIRMADAKVFRYRFRVPHERLGIAGFDLLALQAQSLARFDACYIAGKHIEPLVLVVGYRHRGLSRVDASRNRSLFMRFVNDQNRYDRDSSSDSYNYADDLPGCDTANWFAVRCARPEDAWGLRLRRRAGNEIEHDEDCSGGSDPHGSAEISHRHAPSLVMVGVTRGPDLAFRGGLDLVPMNLQCLRHSNGLLACERR